jgi:hypothetical protein
MRFLAKLSNEKPRVAPQYDYNCAENGKQEDDCQSLCLNVVAHDLR